MCKPVKSADGENKKHSTLGPRQHVVENYRTTKSRSDSKDFKKDVIVLRKISCRCMLQIITVTLFFR